MVTDLLLTPDKSDTVEVDGDPSVSGKIFMSKRTLCYVLGILWLLDGALQLQTFMFTSGFAHQVIAPAATGQPSFVAAPVMWNARLILAHPVLFDAFFASVQIGLGVAFFSKRTVRLAIVASAVWAVGVWYLGEGLGGLAGGHMTALLGAPGAALLYGILGIAARPDRGRLGQSAAPLDEQTLPSWLLWAWGVLWVGYAVLNLLPGNIQASELASQVSANVSSVPSWLGAIDRGSASATNSAGPTGIAFIVAVELAIGLLAFSRSRLGSAALYTGMVLAAVYWAVGQSFGQLFSGQATDPSTGPLVIVFALAVIGAVRQDRPPRRSLLGVGTKSASRDEQRDSF
jgi:hypothetical protein